MVLLDVELAHMAQAFLCLPLQDIRRPFAFTHTRTNPGKQTFVSFAANDAPVMQLTFLP